MASVCPPPTSSTTTTGPSLLEQRDTLFFCTFPCGIEDVVRQDLLANLARAERSSCPPADRDSCNLVLISRPAKKHELAESVRRRFCKAAEERGDRADDAATRAQRSKPPQSRGREEKEEEEAEGPLRPKPQNVEDAICTVRGALFFSLPLPTCPRSVADDNFARSFFDLCIRCQRSIERLCVHLVSAPCVNDLSEIDDALMHAKDKIRNAVVQHVGRLAPYLQAWSVAGDAVTLNAAHIVYRVNAFRQDKSVCSPFTSQNLEAHIGGVLTDLFEAEGWQVNMLYYNVEFFALFDQQHLHLGVCLTPPALPRCGDVLEVEAQLAMECLRQRICTDLASGALAGDGGAAVRQVKGLVPRPGSHRQEVRAVKGQNAMHSALAAALVTYADVQPYMSVADPFCGSGSILVEAALRHWHEQSLCAGGASAAPLLYVGSDLCARDVRNAEKNVNPSTLLETAALLSFVPAMEEGDVAPCVRSYKAALRRVLHSVDYLSELKSNALMETLRCRLGADADVQGCRKALQESLAASVTKRGVKRSSWSSYPTLFFHADATRLPLRPNTLDRIISDLPFGRRCGNHAANRKLYPAILRACHRVLRDPSEAYKGGEAASCILDDIGSEAGEGEKEEKENAEWWQKKRNARAGGCGADCDGGRAVLLTVEGALMSEVLQLYFMEFPFFLVRKPFTVDMGGLFPYVFVLDKLRLPST